MAIILDSDIPVLERGDPTFERELAEALREIKSGENLEKALMAERMAENARMEAEVQRRNVEGLGVRRMVIPTTVYMRWFNTDRDFWKDKKNVDKFLADNPQCRGARPERKYF